MSRPFLTAMALGLMLAGPALAEDPFRRSFQDAVPNPNAPRSEVHLVVQSKNAMNRLQRRHMELIQQPPAPGQLPSFILAIGQGRGEKGDEGILVATLDSTRVDKLLIDIKNVDNSTVVSQLQEFIATPTEVRPGDVREAETTVRITYVEPPSASMDPYALPERLLDAAFKIFMILGVILAFLWGLRVRFPQRLMRLWQQPAAPVMPFQPPVVPAPVVAVVPPTPDLPVGAPVIIHPETPAPVVAPAVVATPAVVEHPTANTTIIRPG